MTEPRTYPHGAAGWVDTAQPDLDAARRLYTALFGWEVTAAAPPDAPGTYLIATLEGRDVAALAPGRSDAATWNTYIAVDDADTTAEAVARGRGGVVEPPADVGPGGRAATCVDPTAARLHLWQAGRRPGTAHTASDRA